MDDPVLKPIPPAPLTGADRKKLIQRAWTAGKLSWKFQGRPWCKEMYDFIRSNWGDTLFLLAHRRSGKSTTGLIIALEECLRHRNTAVAVVCKTKDQARDICDASFAELLADCPKDLLPRRVKNDFAYVFPNGSKIQIIAADGSHSTKARGRKFRFILITEGAYIGDLDTLMKSVFGPTLLDVTGESQGMMLVESTPPDERVDPADAEKYERLYAEAELKERTFFYPLSANKHASENFKKKAEEDSGGIETIFYQREYECRFVREKNATAIPEATHERLFKGDAEKKLPPIVREVARPSSADRYESLDPGGAHLTAVLFGFYDFENDLLVIEDEVTVDNATTDEVASKVREKEAALWQQPGSGKLYRYADNNNVILLNDLWREHKLLFVSTAKDSKDAQINRIRIMVRDGRIAIHPRCTLLTKTLRLAKRAKQERRGFQENEEIGHADLLDALIYMARNLRRNEIPTAPVRRQAEQDFHRPEPKQTSKAAQSLAGFLKRRR